MRLRTPKQKAALERITTLFAQAALRPAFATRYVTLARKIGSRTKTPIPSELKMKMCKACNAYLTSANSTTRIKKQTRIITCKNCKTIKRLPTRNPQ